MQNKNEKVLDQLALGSNTVDELTVPSTNIIPQEVQEINDFDFETEEKPKELTPMQRARASRTTTLIDGCQYQAELIDITSLYLDEKRLGILTFIYNVYDNGGILKKVEDKLFFNELNLNNFNFNEKKLSQLLDKFSIILDDTDYEDVNSICSAIRKLIGTKVILSQTTRNGYQNYNIVSVLCSNEVPYAK